MEMRKYALPAGSLFLAISLLLGCTNGNSASKVEGEGQTTETSPKVDGAPVKLDFMFKSHVRTKDLKTLPMFQELEKKANVDITWDQIRSGFDERRSLMFASGDYPDAFFGRGLGRDNISANRDKFLPLEDLIEQYAPNVQKMFQDFPELKELVTFDDGHIYTLPSVMPFRPQSGNVFMINKVWLDRLGLKTPTTIEEFIQVLRAFKDKDPNQNGIADEVPFDWTPGRGYFTVYGLTGSFGLSHDGSGNLLHVKDGKVSFIPAREEFKDFVKFLHQLNVEGLISKEVFTQDVSQYQARAANPEIPLVGSTLAWTIENRMSLKWAPQYEVLLPLKGTVQNPTWTLAYDNMKFGVENFSIFKNNKNPEATMRWLNEVYEPVMSMQMFYGSMGVAMEETNESGFQYKFLPAQEGMAFDIWKWTNAPGDNAPMYVTTEMEKITMPPESESSRMKLDEVYGPYMAKPDEVYPITMMKFGKEEQSELSLISADLWSYTDKKFAEWVLEGGVDEQWDKYMAEMNKIGLERYVEIYQEALNRYNKAK